MVGTPSATPGRASPTWSSSTSWCLSSMAGRSAAGSAGSPDTRRIPVIMVTGRVDEGDKVLGFELGADDYVTKPFSPRELVARVRAVTRGPTHRGGGQEAQGQGGRSRDRSRALEVRLKGARSSSTPRNSSSSPPLPGAGPGVWAGGAARPRLGPRRFRGAPHRGCPLSPRLRGKFIAAKLSEPGVETVRGVGYRYKDPR